MADKITQQGRPLQVQHPLPDVDDLIAMRLVGSEGLSRPFRFVLDLLSPKSDVAPSDLLGKGLGVTVFGAGNTTRVLNGRVVRWADLGVSGTAGLTHYRAELAPTFTLLHLSSDCRTFENKTVQAIVEAVFEAHKFGANAFTKSARFDLATGSTPTVAYAVQYQESDFEFVSRLLEEHGLYYRFEHLLDKHVLVISDKKGKKPVPEGTLDKLVVGPARLGSRLPDIPGVGPPGKAAGGAAGKAAGAAVGGVVGSLLGPLGSLGGGIAGGLVGGAVSDLVESIIDKVFGRGTPPLNGVTELMREGRMHTKTMAARDFHLLRAPDVDNATSSDPGVVGEHFEFLGDLAGTVGAGVSKATTRRRIEVEEATHDVLRGSSSACTLIPGTRVNVTGGILGAAGADLHLTEVAHVADAGDLLTGDATGLKYVNEFNAVPVDTQFRPERTVARPSVRGTQTAKVVGAGGAGAIDVDANGCVLLEFPWDRGDGKDGASQHRVHVATLWAGTGWGAVHLPRLGQLVLVEFLEGDPDRPIVTGRVYSREHAHPYTLAEHKTQSGIKSRTLGGGADNFNELRFEDKQGEELVHVQAEKNLTVTVKASEARTIGGQRTTDIQGNDIQRVKKGDHKEFVEEGNQILAAKKGDQFFFVTEGRQALDIESGPQKIVATKGEQTFEVGEGDQLFQVTNGNRSIKVDAGSQDTNISGQDATIADVIKLFGQTTIHLEVGGNSLIIDAGGVTITAGASKAEFKKDGTVTIKGVKVEVNGQAAAKVTGAMLNLEGSAMTKLAGPMVQAAGDALLKLAGGVTMAG